MKKKYLPIILCVILFTPLYLVWKTPPKYSKLFEWELPHNPTWQTRGEVDVKAILTQEFTYLSKGARAHAFVSEDKKYVLKLFLDRYRTPHWSVRYLPDMAPFKNYRDKMKQKVSLFTVLNGYHIAYQYDKENTGVIHLHLNNTGQEYGTVTLIDKKGITHNVDLDKAHFIIQHKTELLEDVIANLIREGQMDQAVSEIKNTFALYSKHFKEGLYDLDIGVMKNNGILNGKPVHFDVSKFTISKEILDPDFQSNVLKVLYRDVERWINLHFQEQSTEFLNQFSQQMNFVEK